MPRKRKVDPVLLERLLRDGLTMEQIGQRFGVPKGTISRNAKALRFCKTQDVVLKSAEKINTKKLNAMSRLERIAGIIEGELTYIGGVIKGTSGEERRSWEEAQLKHTAEIRKQISLLREISLTLYNVEETEAFKKIVLEEIGNESPEIRQRILERIKQRRSAGVLSGIGQLNL